MHGKHTKKGEDRFVTGSNLTIAKDETAHDVTVLGGNLEIFGTTTGDVSITGGNVTVHRDAKVRGDLGAMGGNVNVEDGAEIDGDVNVVGGNLNRGEHAMIGGDIVRTDSDEKSDHSDEGKSSHLLRDIGGAITRSAFLFIFGAILLALGTRRMETLRTEMAARPMRSFAMGVVGVLASVVFFVVLCITVIGIPVAFIGVFLALFGGYAGAIAALTTLGEALVRHKTTNTYVHLAVGCAIFLVASSLPFVGSFVTAAVALTGYGVFVATRAAGFIPERKPPPSGPYRSPG
jgi:hypothetical protein